MGLFDYVTCEIPLPIPLTEEDIRLWGGWQTKNLECTLSRVTIGTDRFLRGYNTAGEIEVIPFTGDFYFGLSSARYVATMYRGFVLALAQDCGFDNKPLILEQVEALTCPFCNGSGHLLPKT